MNPYNIGDKVYVFRNMGLVCEVVVDIISNTAIVVDAVNEHIIPCSYVFPTKSRAIRALEALLKELKQEIQDPMKVVLIEDLELCARSESALMYAGIFTIEALVGVAKEKLEELPKLGKKSIHEIVSALDFYGLKLKEM